MRPLIAVVLCVVAALAADARPAAAATPRACPGQPGFACSTLRVPLDHGGAVPGALALRYAVQPRRRGAPRRVLVALAGGPGQPSVALAGSFAVALDPALRHYRLAVIDQRGTAGSHLLRCPAVQELGALDPSSAGLVAGCAQRLGIRRRFFTTADTVLDLERLRKALGADRIALLGISYGTQVALQYARAFPRRVDRLILDSVVGPGRPDGFLLDSYGAVARVLRETCARGRCRDITRDPVADVATLVAELADGTLRGAIFDARGRRHRAAVREGEELMALLTAGDLNPFLQAALPAALAAARAGDPALLMRLRRAAQGAPIRADELSFGVLVTTSCEDAALPYSLMTPLAERTALATGALAALAPDRYSPFDARTVRRTSNVEDCLRWPVDPVRAPFDGPLPDVPALLLSGRLDLRTPLENALATAALLPRADVVALRGGGHDVTDTDITGCAAVALERFAAGRRVGTPCAGRDNGVEPLPLPARSLADFRAPTSVPGLRGRALAAVLDTIADAHVAALISLYAGLPPRGGGLHGGSYAASPSLDARIDLRAYAYVPGLRVTGSVISDNGRPRAGAVRVRGRGVDGTLRFGPAGRVSGTLGGRRVVHRARGARAVAASLSGAATRTPLALRPR